MYWTGQMLENGWGVPADRDKAIEWYKKAAAVGDDKAAQRLAAMSGH